MKHFQKLLISLLGVVLSLCMLPASARAASVFADVRETDWFCDEVQYVYEHGLMDGTTATKFHPEETATRGMVTTTLYRMDGAPAAGGVAFADVAPDEWYHSAVAWASDNGIAGGYTKRTFAPEDNITREQAAILLYRYAQ